MVMRLALRRPYTKRASDALRTTARGLGAAVPPQPMGLAGGRHLPGLRCRFCNDRMELAGLEPATSGVAGRRSRRSPSEPDPVAVSDVTVTRRRTVESFTSLMERWLSLC